MKEKIPAITGWVLLLVAFAVYLYGIYFAIWMPIPKGNTVYIPEPLDSILSSINAILLTNLGAVLGISVAKPSSGLARMTMIRSNAAIVQDPTTMREVIQYCAVIIYLIVLVVCFFVWAQNTFLEEGKIKPVVSVITQNGKTLFGVIAAYIAFILGTKNS
ncbi:MAG: hypothetical protein IPP72_06310 [Chitinophagaceae bacterium]|nr:hypothetical protein [Chitinophagaceae bacterium]